MALTVLKTGYIYASGFQLAFSAIRQNKRLIGIYFGGDTGKQRDKSLKFLMNKAFNELNIETKDKISLKNTKVKINNLEFKIVVGTFKYKKNAEKHLKLIKKKYPKTTKNKEPKIALLKNNDKILYESSFNFFPKKMLK